MVEPLRKLRKDGKPYLRRPAVEKELQGLEKLDLQAVVALAKQPDQAGKPAVSSEAIVHVLRREVGAATTRSPTLGPIDALLVILIRRAETTTRRHIGGFKEEIDREEICMQVTDRVVEEIFEDGERADYAEVNFNDWLKFNRIDACRKQKRKIERVERFGDGIENLADGEAHVVPEEVETLASGAPDPAVAYELKESLEKAVLPPRIERGAFSVEERYRIARMLKRANLPAHVQDAFLLHKYLGVRIDSKDPNKDTLVKRFNRSEKMIRLWIEQAEEVFEKLRETEDENEPDDAKEPGIGSA